MPLHAPLISRAICRFLLSKDGLFLIHGFGPWTYAGARAWRRLRALGRRGILLATTYDVHEREARARLAGSIPALGKLHRWQNYLECVWTRTVVARCERQGYRDAQLVIVNYDSVRQSLLHGYVEDEKIRILPYSTETALLHKSVTGPTEGSSNDPPLLVAVSRHDGRKGVEVRLRSLAALRAAGVPFRATLVGGGPLLGAHKRLASRLGLGSETILAGVVDDSFSYLRRADAFVLPSLEEGSGSMSLIEAMQCGLAIVSTGIDGIPEDVVHEDSALLVRAGDHRHLAGALERVLTDRPLRERLARRSREEFERRFSPESFRRSLAHTYAELGFTP